MWEQGWNKKWDEWVEAGGIVKYDVKLVTSEEGGTAGPAGPRGGSGTAVGGATSGGGGAGGGGGTKRKAEEPASLVAAAVGPAAKVCTRDRVARSGWLFGSLRGSMMPCGCCWIAEAKSVHPAVAATDSSRESTSCSCACLQVQYLLCFPQTSSPCHHADCSLSQNFVCFMCTFPLLHLGLFEACFVQFELALPPDLRQVLIADWERTIKAGQPRPLPRKPSVEDILGGYIKAVRKGATKKVALISLITTSAPTV